jgi:cation transport ATPase
MIHTYKILGMTCDGCRESVTNKLSKIQGVLSASVSLQDEKATISMKHQVPTAEFQDALGAKYAIIELTEKQVSSSTSETSQEKSKLLQLKPLFLIFLFITGAAVLLNYKSWDVGEAMFDFMGLFYIVFSFFKLLDLKGFSESFRMYDPLARLAPVYGWLYPFIELALGLMFLMRFQATIALMATLAVLGVTAIGVTRTLLSKKSIQCACLGTALKLPMTQATFIENSIMIVMAIAMLIKTSAL